MSVIAKREQPDLANPLATAAPIPIRHVSIRWCSSGNAQTIPVPPAPVMTATPGSLNTAEAMMILPVAHFSQKQLRDDNE